MYHSETHVPKRFFLLLHKTKIKQTRGTLKVNRIMLVKKDFQMSLISHEHRNYSKRDRRFSCFIGRRLHLVVIWVDEMRNRKFELHFMSVPNIIELTRYT